MNPNTNEKSNKIEICDVIVRYINEEFRKAYKNMKSCHLHKIVFPYELTSIKWKDVVGGDIDINNILNNINSDDNLYFIFCEHEKLLYVGKYKKDNKKRLNQHLRLYQHLIDRQGTNSMLPQIQDYVLGNKNRCKKCKRKCADSKEAACADCCKKCEEHYTIYVGTLRVDPPEYAQLAETYYIKEYEPKWNRRID